MIGVVDLSTGSTPAARRCSALRFSDLGESRFVILGVLIDGLLYLSKQTAVILFVRNSITQVEHRVGFAPIFAVFPDFNRFATHLMLEFHQPRIFYVVTVMKKNLVVDRNQPGLKI